MLSEQDAKEDLLLQRWREKSEGINAWLGDIEQSLSQLETAPTEPSAVAVYTQQLEVSVYTI